MAASEEGLKARRIARLCTQAPAPFIRDGCQMRVKRGAQLGDERRQGIGEVLVFAPPEAVAAHHHAAAEAALFGIELRQLPAVCGSEEARQYGAALGVQLRGYRGPANSGDILVI